MVVGAVAVAVNLGQGITTLHLDAATLADIYLGRITRWSDPALRSIGSQPALPDLRIDVLRRLDGSGTTFAFTSWLSAVSKAWEARVGADVAVDWPVGRGVRGNAGMARAIAATSGAIGYVGAAQAAQDGLTAARMRNATGHFVGPDAKAVRAALAAAGWDKAQRQDPWVEPLVQAAGDESYPIVATVYGMVGRQATRRARMAREFVSWTLEQGQSVADRLGYVPLPAPLAGTLLERLRSPA